jgi:hypothetical protein
MPEPRSVVILMNSTNQLSGNVQCAAGVPHLSAEGVAMARKSVRLDAVRPLG